MKTTIKYFIAIFSLFTISLFTCSSVSYADGAPMPPDVSILNAKINGIPFTFGCGQLANFAVNSLIEFDIHVQTLGDLPTLVNYSFNPATPPGSPTFSPVLPVVIVHDTPTTIHFSWTTPAVYFGSLFITTNDPIFTTQCEMMFDWLLPVELSSFISIVHGSDVSLNWTTNSEINNSHFNIERSDANSGISETWSTIATVQGNGNSNEPVNYTYNDDNLSTGKYSYRLKQIDFNGNYEYHNLSDEVVIGVPDKFSLSQNYPNPFNPTTNLEFGLSNLEFVSLKVYDAMGKEVATLVNEIKPAGRYVVEFSAKSSGKNLGSGVYFYKIQAGSFTAVRKMFLIK
jgi:hypothetical protein